MLSSLQFRLVIDQTHHVLVLLTHDPRRYTFRLADDISELTHRDAILLLPLENGVEVSTLPIDAEIRVRLITNVDPIMDERVGVGSAGD